MIDCDEIRPRLTALIDDELPKEEVRLLRLHLEECAACTAIIEDYKVMRTAVKAAPQSDTVDLWEAISAQISDSDDTSAIVSELRRLREEMTLMREEMTLMREEVSRVRGEMADLRREPSKRPAESVMPRTPSRFPGLPQTDQRPYRLV